MKIHLFAGSIHLGDTQAQIIDASMGVIGGQFNPAAAYLKNYRSFFRSHLETPNWEKLTSLSLRAIEESGEVVETEGGICIEDFQESEEIEVALCGVEREIITRIYQKQLRIKC